MLNKLTNYINNTDYKIVLTNSCIDIINYTKLISINKTYISILIDNKKIIIKGDNLLPKKILSNEILLTGNINNIEVINAW